MVYLPRLIQLQKEETPTEISLDTQKGKRFLFVLEESKKKAAEVTRRAVNAISGMGEKKEFLIQLALDLQMRIS